MRKLTFLSFLVCMSLFCFAQKSLLFYHIQTLRTIELKVGHKATILYKGYLGQAEFISQVVTEISDSTITLGTDAQSFFASQKPGKNIKQVHKVIRISDITGFRRMTIGRQLGKAGLSIAGVVGSIYLLPYVYGSGAGKGTAFFISFASGLTILGINQLVFPENIKYYFKDGWEAKVVNQD
jgi:hypothetical protein